MDRELYIKICSGNKQNFLNYIKQNENSIDALDENLGTVLHLAAELGKEELAAEMLRLRPQMAAAQNRMLETPLHEACRRGCINIVRMLLEPDPRVVDKVNSKNQSVLDVACQHRRFEILKLLISNYPRLLMLEGDGSTTSLNAAASAGDTVLHLAARTGQEELAAKVLQLRPQMVATQNGILETPLHEACRGGYINIVRMLLETDPSVVDKVNSSDESVLHVACQIRRLKIVKLLIKDYPGVLMLEKDGSTTSLHVAVLAGDTEITKELLTVGEELAWKKDRMEQTPLHLACSKGHLDVIREILRVSPQLAYSRTIRGETVFHFATRNKYNRLEVQQLKVVKCIRKILNDTKLVKGLVNTPDNDGNTILHLAVTNKFGLMVTYLLRIGANVNAINRDGYTALDVFKPESGYNYLKEDLLKAGAKKGYELLQTSRENGAQPLNDTDLFSRRIEEIPEETTKELHSHLSFPSSPNYSSLFDFSEIDDRQIEVEDEDLGSTRKHSRRRRHQKKVQDEGLPDAHTHQHEKEIQNEGLRNTRNTIAVVAVLIATVTFTGGINPPGGFNENAGITNLGRQTSFKVFMVCNIVALFMSLGIVIFLVSIIPFRRRPMMRLLVVTRTVMWLSVAFMAAAYIAALWAILPRGRGMAWLLVALVSIGGAGTLVMFGGLGVLLARQWVKKRKWRKENNGAYSSSNSDLASSGSDGFHIV